VDAVAGVRVRLARFQQEIQFAEEEGLVRWQPWRGSRSERDWPERSCGRLVPWQPRAWTMPRPPRGRAGHIVAPTLARLLGE